MTNGVWRSLVSASVWGTEGPEFNLGTPTEVQTTTIVAPLERRRLWHSSHAHTTGKWAPVVVVVRLELALETARCIAKP